MKKFKAKDLFTEPTTQGITYINKEGSRWVEKGVNMIDEGFPVQLDIELNTTCNLRCIMCFQRTSPPEPEIMDFELVKSILREAAKEGAESVKLQYRGEPLLYPKIIEVFKLAKQLGLFVHFNTNGTLLTERIIDALIEYQVDKIIFSIDGVYPMTYDNIRIGGKVVDVMNNVRALANKKLQQKSKYPLIAAHAVVQKSNKMEIDNGLYKMFWSQWAEEIAYMEEFNLVDGSKDETELPDWHCAQLWQRLVILADGRVVPCCGGIDYENNIAYTIGNLNYRSIKEVWHSNVAKHLKQLHREGLSHEIEMCAKCRIRKNVIAKLKEND